MPKITVLPMAKTFEYRTGQSLLNILLEQKIFVDNPCNGKGNCGKCKVRLLEGELEPLCDTERRFLREEEVRNGIRLSCMVRPQEDLRIEILQEERTHEVLTQGYVPRFQRDLIEDNAKPRYGVAIDIGTTTVVCALVDMRSGKEVAQASRINAQKHFGLDVLTRITYEIEHPQTGVQELQKAIVGSINDMIKEACEKAQVSQEEICEITVAANCTMMHMLLGVEAVSLGRTPYTPVFVEAKDIKAREIGIYAGKEARLYCLPSVSAYIGADIVAGVMVCQLKESKDNVLFIDIGTNGEIVLSNSGRLLCCSCAAGPALEGMNISSGMRAAEGAIEDVQITQEGVEIRVIGNGEPEGICGSGILAGIKELLRTGIVRKEGAFIQPEKLADDDNRKRLIRQTGVQKECILTEEKTPISITQKDVRQVQLAKGAILSGFVALLRKAGIQMQDLDRVIIAGQFGAHLPADSLVGTGILPEEVKEKIVYVGNTSKTGAYMALLSEDVKRQMEELAQHMDYMELGDVEDYDRLFVDCLCFPEVS